MPDQDATRAEIERLRELLRYTTLGQGDLHGRAVERLQVAQSALDLAARLLKDRDDAYALARSLSETLSSEGGYQP